jgi:hypothetical protein
MTTNDDRTPSLSTPRPSSEVQGGRYNEAAERMTNLWTSLSTRDSVAELIVSAGVIAWVVGARRSKGRDDAD